MPQTSVFSSFTYAYLARALVLLRTLRAAHPDWEVCALVVEDPGDEIGRALHADALAAFDRVVFAAELDLPRFRAWMFKHDVVEACTAVKASMLRRLLDDGAERVVYLDPDIAVFHPLDSVVAALADSSVVLTPHVTEPNERWATILDNEVSALRHGVYNLGFIAVRNDPVGRRFAAWWDRMLREACYDEPERGIFTDQKYCDLVPALFAPVHVLADPGCNVASWNLSRRRVAIGANGRMTVNGTASLKFYHFTKINSAGDTMTDRYAAANVATYEIWEWYRREVRRREPPVAPGWSYAAFADGQAIPRDARLEFRRRLALYDHHDDPFASGPQSLQHRFQTSGLLAAL